MLARTLLLHFTMCKSPTSPSFAVSCLRGMSSSIHDDEEPLVSQDDSGCDLQFPPPLLEVPQHTNGGIKELGDSKRGHPRQDKRDSARKKSGRHQSSVAAHKLSCPSPSWSSQETGAEVRREGTAITLRRLTEEVLTCHFYYANIGQAKAASLLQGRSEGTYLLRDSSDNNALFTLSVMTNMGPSHVRIRLTGSFLTLEALQEQQKKHTSVLRLLEDISDLCRKRNAYLRIGDRRPRLRLQQPLLQ